GKRTKEKASVQAETEAETDEVATAARLIPATIGRAAILRITEPRTTTQHSVLSRIRPLWVTHVFLWVVAVPVLAPLVNIAVHVMKAPSICGEATYWRGFLSIN